MKGIGYVLGSLLSLPLAAQLTLPEFWIDEPLPQEGPSPVPADAQSPPAAPPSPENDETLRRMLQEMNMGGRVNSRVDAPRERETQARLERVKRLTGGPEILTVAWEQPDGQKQKLILFNQTLQLDTGSMRIPFRLHELASLERIGTGNTFHLRFQDGDELRGTLEGFRFLQKEGDDGVKLRSHDQIKNLQF